MRAAATTSPLFAALRLFSDGSLPRSTNRLEGGGSRPHTPAFRCVRLVLQTASYREQRSAWQAGAAAPTLKLPAALGLSFRRNAIAGNETLGRWGLSPHTPPLWLRSACLADSSLPLAARRLAGGGCRAHTPAFRCVRLVLQTARYRGQRIAWRVWAAAPTSPLSAALGLSCRRSATAGNEMLGRWGLPRPHPRFSLHSGSLTGVSLPRATKRLAGGGCRPHTPAFRCARVLQTTRYRGQRHGVGAVAPQTPAFRCAPQIKHARPRDHLIICCGLHFDAHAVRPPPSRMLPVFF